MEFVQPQIPFVLLLLYSAVHHERTNERTDRRTDVDVGNPRTLLARCSNLSHVRFDLAEEMSSGPKGRRVPIDVMAQHDDDDHSQSPTNQPTSQPQNSLSTAYCCCLLYTAACSCLFNYSFFLSPFFFPLLLLLLLLLQVFQYYQTQNTAQVYTYTQNYGVD